MANTIVVLEDDADRTASMREVLVTHFASHELVFIDNAPELVEWLRLHLREAVLINADGMPTRIKRLGVCCSCSVCHSCLSGTERPNRGQNRPVSAAYAV